MWSDQNHINTHLKDNRKVLVLVIRIVLNAYFNIIVTNSDERVEIARSGGWSTSCSWIRPRDEPQPAHHEQFLHAQQHIYFSSSIIYHWRGCVPAKWVNLNYYQFACKLSYFHKTVQWITHILLNWISSCTFLIMAIFYCARRNPKNLVYIKFYYINLTKLTSLSRRPIQNVTSNDRGIGNAQLWMVKKIIKSLGLKQIQLGKNCKAKQLE